MNLMLTRCCAVAMILMGIPVLLASLGDEGALLLALVMLGAGVGLACTTSPRRPWPWARQWLLLAHMAIALLVLASAVFVRPHPLLRVWALLVLVLAILSWLMGRRPGRAL